MEEISDRMANIEVDIKNINREKRKFVTSKELDEIENYMDLMNPIHSSFITDKEFKEKMEEEGYVSEKKVEKLIEDKLEQVAGTDNQG
jgi:hypothetical protein